MVLTVSLCSNKRLSNKKDQIGANIERCPWAVVTSLTLNNVHGDHLINLSVILFACKYCIFLAYSLKLELYTPTMISIRAIDSLPTISTVYISIYMYVLNLESECIFSHTYHLKSIYISPKSQCHLKHMLLCNQITLSSEKLDCLDKTHRPLIACYMFRIVCTLCFAAGGAVFLHFSLHQIIWYMNNSYETVACSQAPFNQLLSHCQHYTLFSITINAH